MMKEQADDSGDNSTYPAPTPPKKIGEHIIY